MNHCETCEAQISALLDGELEPAEVIETMDHAVACNSCRRFYGEARKIDRLMRPAGLRGGRETLDSPVTAMLPPGVWEEIERSGRRQEASSFREWGLRAAALVVVAFGLWSIGGLKEKPSYTPERSYDISLEEDGAGMTEARFVEMTAELMRSDRRYHRAMFDVMKDIREATGSGEGSEDVPAADSEDRDQNVREGESRLPS